MRADATQTGQVRPDVGPVDPMAELFAQLGEPTYAVSFFDNEFDNVPKPERVTLAEIERLLSEFREAPCTVADCVGKKCPHKSGAAWSSVRFREGGLRRDEYAEAISGLTLDFDGKTEREFEVVDQKLAPYWHIDHNTHGDRPGRYSRRAFIPFAEEAPADDRLWDAIVAHLGLTGIADEGAKALSQPAFLPTRRSDVAPYFKSNPGALFDARAIYASLPTREQHPAASERAPDDSRIPDGRRNTTLLSIAGKLRRQGLSEDEIRATLLEVNRARCEPPLEADEVATVAISAAKYEPEIDLVRDAVDHAALRRGAGTEVGGWGALLEAALGDVRKWLGSNSDDTSHPEPLFEPASSVIEREHVEPPFVVKGLVPRGGTTLLCAGAKVGKTQALVDIVISAVLGIPALGCAEFATDPSGLRAAYFFAEDFGRSVQKIIRADAAGRGMTPEELKERIGDRLHLQPRGRAINLLEEGDLALVVASVRARGGTDLLAIEPMRDLHLGDEDSSTDMSRVMRGLRCLSVLLDCTLITAHHAGLNRGQKLYGPELIRGSSAIRGAYDAGVFMTLESKSTRHIEATVVTELKAAAGAPRFRYELHFEDDTEGRAKKLTWSVMFEGEDRGGAGSNAALAQVECKLAEDRVLDLVREILRANTAREATGEKKLLGRLGGGYAKLKGALAEAKRKGWIVEKDRGGGWQVTLAGRARARAVDEPAPSAGTDPKMSSWRGGAS